MTPKFFTDDGREVRFVAAEFPGDEGFAIEGAARVARKTGIAIDNELLVSRLHSGRYWCFRVFVGEDCVGGVVTETIRKEHSGDEVLHVWLLWGGRIREWLKPALVAAKQMADEIGCARVRLASPRWAWIKLLPDGELSWVLEI